MKTTFRFLKARRWLHYSALIILPFSGLAATNDLTYALQKGLFEEEANHNLEAAAEAYQAVSARFDQDRKLAATAIFRLGEVYRKQGKTNEAVAQYERIVREFSDQQTLATLSRQNLAGIGRDAPTSASTAEKAEVSTRIAAVKNEMISAATEIERLNNLSSGGRGIAVLQNYPNPVLTELMKQLSTAEQNLAGLRQDRAPEHPDVVQAVTLVETINKQIEEHVSEVFRGLYLKLETAKALLAKLEKTSVVSAISSGSNETAVATTDDEEAEIRRIQVMIQNSPDLKDAPSPPSMLTPLCYAASKGQLRVAKFLLDNGALIDRKTQESTPLHHATSAGHKAMVELLLERGADVNARDATGGTALHLAAASGYMSVAEALVERKAEIGARISEKNLEQTPLHVAAKSGNAAMAVFLVSNGADLETKDRNGMTALSLAAAYRQHEVITKLLALGAQPDVQGNDGRTALSFAVERGLLDSVKALLAAKADPNAGTNDLPLLGAAYGKNLEIAELLLRAGANPNLASMYSREVRSPGSPQYGSRGRGSFGPYLPLQIAVSQGDAAMVKLLLKFKADANATTSWDLRRPLASWTLTDPQVLKALLEGGADANAEAWEGEPLLAAAFALPDAVELLLAHGAKANVRNRQNRTPLDLSAERDCLKCIQVLLEAKADPNATSAQGVAALHWAAWNGSKEMVEALVSRGADVNSKTGKGETPLHWAMRMGNRGVGSATMAELLLSKGADPNVRNNEDLTPLDLAKQPSAPMGMMRPPPPPIAPGVFASQISGESKPIDLATLLRQHGARDDLPKLDRIEVRRPSANYAAIAFQMDTNGWNEFSLLELMALHYGFMSTERNAVWEVNKSTLPSKFWRAPACQFPDLGRVVIRRPASAGAQRTELAVNVAELLDSGDCARDVKLQPGDIVEIPEADHPVNEKWAGLTAPQLSTLLHCVSRTITISVKGTATALPLLPAIAMTNDYGPNGERFHNLTRGSFMLKSVLAQSRLLRASSDVSRVKVTRRVDGKTQEWLLDCGAGSDPDLWLRDGDVIEVPDKP